MIIPHIHVPDSQVKLIWELSMAAHFIEWKQILTADKALPEPHYFTPFSVIFLTSLPLSSLGPSHTSFLATLEFPGKCLFKTKKQKILHCSYLCLEHSSQNIHKANPLTYFKVLVQMPAFLSYWPKSAY